MKWNYFSVNIQAQAINTNWKGNRIKLATTDDEYIKVLRATYLQGFKKGQQWPELEGIGMIDEASECFEEEVL